MVEKRMMFKERGRKAWGLEGEQWSVCLEGEDWGRTECTRDRLYSSRLIKREERLTGTV